MLIFYYRFRDKCLNHISSAETGHVRKLQTEMRELRERGNIRHNEIKERDQARQNHSEERAQAIENRFEERLQGLQNHFEERVNVLTDINHKRGTLGGTQYRNPVRKNGKYRNTASKIV